MYRGAVGDGASAKALDASAPMTILLLAAFIVQHILSHVWSRLAAFISLRVTVPFIRGEPLHTPLEFLVPHSFKKSSQSYTIWHGWNGANWHITWKNRGYNLKYDTHHWTAIPPRIWKQSIQRYSWNWYQYTRWLSLSAFNLKIIYRSAIVYSLSTAISQPHQQEFHASAQHCLSPSH